MQTQCQQILTHLQRGYGITSMQAMRLYGIVSLPKRICELKEQGIPVRAERLKLPSGKSCNQYLL